MTIHSVNANRWKSMKSHKILFHQLLIDFQYQSINCYRLLSIVIDFDRLATSSIAYAGHIINFDCYLAMYCYCNFQTRRQKIWTKKYGSPFSLTFANHWNRKAQRVTVLCLQSRKLDGTIPPLQITLQESNLPLGFRLGYRVMEFLRCSDTIILCMGFGLWARSSLQATFRTLVQSQTNAWE